MKHIYIFNSAVRAANYGIGTYIDQLTTALQGKHFNITMVNIVYTDKEFAVSEKNGIRSILIPGPVISKSDTGTAKFDRSIPFILMPYVDKNEENIFHLNYIGARYLASSLKQYFGGKIILTVHYTDWSFALLGDKRKLYKILRQKEEKRNTFSEQIIKALESEKETLKICDRIIAISERSYKDLISIYGVPRSKLTLISNSLKDTYKSKNDTVQLRKRLKISDDELIVIFAGRLDAVKGVKLLIKSFEHVLEKFPAARLVIAGEGDFKSLMSISKPFWSRITFTGFISKKQLSEFYSISDIGIVCSIHEEFGYVAIEMMMHRLPLIVSDTGGLAEIVDDNLTGLKVPVKTVKGIRRVCDKTLSEKIICLLDDPELADELGYRGRQKFLARYNLSLFKDKMLDLYQSL